MSLNRAGAFTVDLITGSDAIPGSANPVTGSDIGVDGSLAGRPLEGETDLFCETAAP